MHTVRLLLLMVLVPVLTGCTTTYYRRQDESARLRADVQRLSNELGLLQNRVSELSTTQEYASQQIVVVRGEQVQNQRQLNERVAAVERSLQGQGVAREQLRAEIVEEISKKVTAVVRSATPAPPPQRTERGYEHIVKAGETLSEIAKAYNTQIDVIVRNNGLKDANSLRVGQKLFIAE